MTEGDRGPSMPYGTIQSSQSSTSDITYLTSRDIYIYQIERNAASSVYARYKCRRRTDNSRLIMKSAVCRAPWDTKRDPAFQLATAYVLYPFTARHTGKTPALTPIGHSSINKCDVTVSDLYRLCNGYSLESNKFAVD